MSRLLYVSWDGSVYCTITKVNKSVTYGTILSPNTCVFWEKIRPQSSKRCFYGKHFLGNTEVPKKMKKTKREFIDQFELYCYGCFTQAFVDFHHFKYAKNLPFSNQGGSHFQTCFHLKEFSLFPLGCSPPTCSVVKIRNERIL